MHKNFDEYQEYLIQDSLNFKDLTRIAYYYGSVHQMMKLHEELGELESAIARYQLAVKNGNMTAKIADNLTEEIADVENLLTQIKYILMIEPKKLGKIKRQKIDRQLKRIDEERAKKNERVSQN